MMDINKAIATAVKTGKVSFGAKNTIKNAKIGKARLIIVASNCPQREDISYYCSLSNIPMIIYNGNSIRLGAVSGNPFMVSALTIREPGDSDIIELMEDTNG